MQRLVFVWAMELATVLICVLVATGTGNARRIKSANDIGAGIATLWVITSFLIVVLWVSGGRT